MDIAILVLLLVDLALTACVFYERRNVPLRLTKEELKTFEAAVQSGKLVEVPPPPKYTEPKTETVKVRWPDGLQPPFPAPMLGPDTLKMALIHRYLDDNVWSRFVDDFYARAMRSHVVRAYFEGKDLNDIKKKFLATLLIVCDKGVSEAAAVGLVKLHAHLGITVEAYDETMEALEKTLLAYRVPEGTILQFVPMVKFFRETMVTA